MYTNATNASARRALACCCAALCLVFVLPLRAAAWSESGHKTVAVLAYGLLTERARKNMDAVLQGRTVDAVVMWPDDLRYVAKGCTTAESPSCGRDYRPETARWHQVDLAYEGDGKYTPAVCPSTRTGDCIVAAIEDFKKSMARSAARRFDSYDDTNKRRLNDALRFMLHLVGDIHQPLHCANRNNDAGGNGVYVTWEGEPVYQYGPVWNLHAVWDEQVVEREIRRAGKTGFADYAAWLGSTLTPAQRDYATRKTNQLAAGQAETTAAWAERSHQLAKKHAYDQLPTKKAGQSTRGTKAPDDAPLVVLDEDYFNQALPVARQQLALGGVRLARVLNEIFDRDQQ